MKFLFDFFPLILFFIAYKWQGIYAATGVAIAASFVQVGYSWLRHHKLEKSHVVTLVIITFFGGATLLLQDETFIKWKPTVLNWVFAVAFLTSQFVGKKTLTEHMMGTAVKLPTEIWLRINFSWIIFFLAMGAANLFVAFNYDTDTWVDFKVFGMLGLTIVFLVLQVFYLARHVQQEPDPGQG